MLDLSNGRLDAVMSDKIVLIDWMKTDGADCCNMVGDVAGTETEAGIAVRLDDSALRDRLQTRAGCNSRRRNLRRYSEAVFRLRHLRQIANAAMFLERVEGIEPSRSAWEADKLPLHHTRAEG